MTSYKLGFGDQSIWTFQNRPLSSHWKHIRKKVDGELVCVPTEGMVHAEGGS